MKTWQFQQFKPAKARGKFSAAVYHRGSWIVEEKFDGDRRIAQFCNDGVRFTGSKVSVKDGLFVEKTDNVPHLNGRLGQMLSDDVPSHPMPRIMVGTVLDGEIVCDFPGARSRDVTSIMGSSAPVAIEKQLAKGWVKYKVFDCLFYRGQDLRALILDERKKFMKRALMDWHNPFAEMVLGIPAVNGDRMFDEITSRGGEGVVFKDLYRPYGDENSWVKRKLVDTYDVVVMGYDAGKGKYEGLIGAIKFGQYRDGKLTPCGQCSGIDDNIRLTISKAPKRYIGKVMEISANFREPSGKFRHPQYKQFRNNKSAKDCTWDAT